MNTLRLRQPSFEGRRESPSTNVGNEIAKAFGFTFDHGKGPRSRKLKRLRNWRLRLQSAAAPSDERYKETLAVKYAADANGVGESVVGGRARFQKAAYR